MTTTTVVLVPRARARARTSAASRTRLTNRVVATPPPGAVAQPAGAGPAGAGEGGDPGEPPPHRGVGRVATGIRAVPAAHRDAGGLVGEQAHEGVGDREPVPEAVVHRGEDGDLPGPGPGDAEPPAAVAGVHRRADDVGRGQGVGVALAQDRVDVAVGVGDDGAPAQRSRVVEAPGQQGDPGGALADPVGDEGGPVGRVVVGHGDRDPCPEHLGDPRGRRVPEERVLRAHPLDPGRAGERRREVRPGRAPAQRGDRVGVGGGVGEGAQGGGEVARTGAVPGEAGAGEQAGVVAAVARDRVDDDEGACARQRLERAGPAPGGDDGVRAAGHGGRVVDPAVDLDAAGVGGGEGVQAGAGVRVGGGDDGVGAGGDHRADDRREVAEAEGAGGDEDAEPGSDPLDDGAFLATGCKRRRFARTGRGAGTPTRPASARRAPSPPAPRGAPAAPPRPW